MFGRRRAAAHGWDEQAGPGGRIVAVWGPTGTPGRSTVATGLAGALADAGRVALGDVDLARGALQVLLGADVGANVASASRFPAPRGVVCVWQVRARPHTDDTVP